MGQRHSQNLKKLDKGLTDALSEQEEEEEEKYQAELLQTFTAEEVRLVNAAWNFQKKLEPGDEIVKYEGFPFAYSLEGGRKRRFVEINNGKVIYLPH